MIKTIHEYRINTDCNHVHLDTHPEFSNPHLSGINSDNSVSACTMFCKVDILNFINGEELVTETNPRCGSCKCAKCPIVGHSYSFKEEQELIMIQENLKYDEDHKCWTTRYPWLVDRVTLPDNYYVALATLKSTKHILAKDPEWAEKFKAQIQDTLDRNVARMLSKDERQTGMVQNTT